MSGEARTLHTVNKSPFERNTLDSCLRLAAAGSAILLIEDGVYAAIQDSTASARITERAGDFKFYALGPDLEARGLKEKSLVDGVEVIDYGGFVDLVTEHETAHAWM